MKREQKNETISTRVWKIFHIQGVCQNINIREQYHQTKGEKGAPKAINDKYVEYQGSSKNCNINIWQFQKIFIVLISTKSRHNLFCILYMLPFRKKWFNLHDYKVDLFSKIKWGVKGFLC